MTAMPGEPGRPASVDRDDLELLHELEANTPARIRAQRSFDRVHVRAAVVVQPGNTSEVRSMKLRGVTSDISAGGCQLLLPVPLAVGDAYRLHFDRTELDLPMVFARCVRCRLLREDAFECGFAFFHAVELGPEVLVRDAA